MEEIEHLRDELIAKNTEFRELAKLHGQYESRLSELVALAHPNDDELTEEATLKKKKLAIKDQMYEMLRTYKSSAAGH